jgi:hypothetical protein
MVDNVRVYYKEYHTALAAIAVTHPHLTPSQNQDVINAFEVGFQTYITAAAKGSHVGALEAAMAMKHTTAIVWYYADEAPISMLARSGMATDAEYVEGDLDAVDVLSTVMDHINPDWRLNT